MNENTEFSKLDAKEILNRILPFVVTIHKKRWKILLINFVVGIILILYLIFIIKQTYTSSVTILPDYGGFNSSLSQLSGLASFAGISLGKSVPTQIYANLVYSEEILGAVINKKYKVANFKDSINLIDYFEIKEDEDLPNNLAKRKSFLAAYEKLTKSIINTDLDRMTQILTITVKIDDSKLSAEIVNSIVMSLENYVKTKRKSFATEQRKYIEKRLSQIKDSLSILENQYKKFRELNRAILGSPNLTLEDARYRRGFGT